MIECINNLIEITSNFIVNTGPFVGMSFVIIESIIPVLPLAIFIALNIIAFGKIFGFLISWIGTSIGCLIAFMLVRKKVSNWFNKFIKDKSKIKSLMNYIDNLTLPQLTIITALPFTPAFLINIACGLSKIDFKKFLLSILISKLAVVYFWGYIGSSLLESIQRPQVLLEIALMLIIFYVISNLINKKLKLK